jgi:hypothetical protein
MNEHSDKDDAAGVLQKGYERSAALEGASE